MTVKRLLVGVFLVLTLALLGGLWWVSAKPARVVEVQNEITALDKLKASRNVTVKQYSFGTMVESIDGVQNGTDNKYWVYYVNGKLAEVGADQYKVNPGDVIEWKFEQLR